MKAVVLIVENRTAYRERLLSGLQQSGQNYDYIAVSDLNQVNDLDEDTSNRVILILTAEHFFSDLEDFFPGTLRLGLTDQAPNEHPMSYFVGNSEILEPSIERNFYSHYLEPIEYKDKYYLSRQSSVNLIKEVITAVLTKPLSSRLQEQESALRNSTSSNESSGNLKQGDHSLGCLLCFTRSERIKASTTILKSGKRKAHDMIYLPLMPLYDMAFSFRTGSRETLGDLLLTLKSGLIPEQDDLGNFLYLHNDGYYTFPCPDRADDLICADNRSLRELVLLLKKYTETRAAPTHSLIEASALTMEKHAMIAALCDYLVIEIPAKTTDAALIAQQELSIFLSKLPASCEIYESSNIIKLSGEAPWFY